MDRCCSSHPLRAWDRSEDLRIPPQRKGLLSTRLSAPPRQVSKYHPEEDPSSLRFATENGPQPTSERKTEAGLRVGMWGMWGIDTSRSVFPSAGAEKGDSRHHNVHKSLAPRRPTPSTLQSLRIVLSHSLATVFLTIVHRKVFAGRSVDAPS